MSVGPGRMRIALLLTALALAQPGCRGLKLFGPAEDKGASDAGKVRAASANGLPGRYSFRIAPYVFLSDFKVDEKLPLFRELAGLRDQVCKELQLPASDRPVLVYLFEDRDSYKEYMQRRYPGFPDRRAYFVAQPRGALGSGEDLLVFTCWGDRIEQDLRHELTHGLLHSVLREVPLWLDEGLAEFFELPPENRGINDSHLNHIRRSVVEPFTPDLARLERLEQVKDMQAAEYREAWAWAHFLLRGDRRAKAALLAYVQQLRATDKPGTLRPRLVQAFDSPEDALRRHIAGLDFSPRVAPTAQR